MTSIHHCNVNQPHFAANLSFPGEKLYLILPLLGNLGYFCCFLILTVISFSQVNNMALKDSTLPSIPHQTTFDYGESSSLPESPRPPCDRAGRLAWTLPMPLKLLNCVFHRKPKMLWAWHQDSFPPSGTQNHDSIWASLLRDIICFLLVSKDLFATVVYFFQR